MTQPSFENRGLRHCSTSLGEEAQHTRRTNMADVEFAGANGEEQYMEASEHAEHQDYEAQDPSMNPGDKINASKNDEDNR